MAGNHGSWNYPQPAGASITKRTRKSYARLLHGVTVPNSLWSYILTILNLSRNDAPALRDSIPFIRHPRFRILCELNRLILQRWDARDATGDDRTRVADIGEVYYIILRVNEGDTCGCTRILDVRTKSFIDV